MLVINASQVNFSAESRDTETGITYAYFDASYGTAQTYLGMTIHQDDPQIMEDFADFKDRVINAKNEFGLIDIGEEEEPIDEVENL